MLLAAYRRIAATTVEGQPGSPAAEWLLDNFHLVEQQVREVRTDLPEGYYRELPKLSDGPLAGYPRVFGMAWAFVAHTDSRFDPEMLTRFVRAYQTVQPLTIGELWAVAITLRIVLIENLRRSASLILHRRTERQDADLLADRLLGTKDQAARSRRAGVGRTDGAVRQLRRPARAAAARAGSGSDPRGRLARAAPRGGGNDVRRAGAPRASAARRHQRHGAQHHHQHGPDLRRRLGDALRSR